MKVLVDTSVWSLALRRRNSSEEPAVEQLRWLIDQGRVAMIGPIRQELLSGSVPRSRSSGCGNIFVPTATKHSRRETSNGRQSTSIPVEPAELGLQHGFPDLRRRRATSPPDPDDRRRLHSVRRRSSHRAARLTESNFSMHLARTSVSCTGQGTPHRLVRHAGQRQASVGVDSRMLTHHASGVNDGSRARRLPPAGAAC